jgi:hypothetical protein
LENFTHDRVDPLALVQELYGCHQVRGVTGAAPMMLIIPKWTVTIRYADRHPIVFGMSDNFSANVLRKVADLDFAAHGLEQPLEIVVSAALTPPANTTITSTAKV